MIEAVKTILNAGGIVKYSYKSKIDDWFGDVYIHRYNGKYYISPHLNGIDDIDKAVVDFLQLVLSSKNVGYIQNRLRDKGIDWEDYDLEKPSKEVKKLFYDEGLIVDKELEQILK